MCPSSIPLAAEDKYLTDETVFMSLFNFKSEKPLPLNVTSDVNPYQYRPSDLPGHFLENSSELDCILTGDYFELNDLVDTGSRSSSSSDSSCLTMTSEEYFDSIALLEELQDDIILDEEMKDSRVKLNPSAPVKSTEVVLHTATSASLRNSKECKPSAKVTSKAVKRRERTSNDDNITSS